MLDQLSMVERVLRIIPPGNMPRDWVRSELRVSNHHVHNHRAVQEPSGEHKPNATVEKLRLVCARTGVHVEPYLANEREGYHTAKVRYQPVRG